MVHNPSLSDFDSEKVAKVALLSCSKIMKKWQLDDADQFLLLGLDLKYKHYELTDVSLSLVSKEVLVRVSYVLSIYRCLKTLFPDDKRALHWLYKSNQYFEGHTALSIMKSSDDGLRRVAEYLEAQCV